MSNTVITHKKDEKGVCDASGSKNDSFTTALTHQALRSLWLAHAEGEEREQIIEAVVASLKGINPKDELEGMLAAQMVATHAASMECFRRAMIEGQPCESRDANLNYASKLTRTYTTQIEALKKYRSKGEQKMTVEHVHVHNGGQAIVGDVHQRVGGGNESKSE